MSANYKFNPKSTVFLFLVLVAMLLNCNYAESSLLVSRTQFNNNMFGYGTTNWSQMTSILNTELLGNITVANNLENSLQVMSYDSIWVDLRGQSDALSTAEYINLQTYINSGHRVVLIGENNTNWLTWNTSLLGMVGGTPNGSAGYNTSTARLTTNELTTNVDQVLTDFVGIASGNGTQLFQTGFATLWGPYNNVLTILDIDIFTNGDIDRYNDLQFAQNVAHWVATPVPIPGAVWLLGTGLIGLIGFRRNLKK
jgi:hypothetical protein